MIQGGRILVTGGAGFVGSHIVDQALGLNAKEVIVIDNMIRGRRENLANALATGRVRLVEADIRDAALLESLVAHSDVVFHQAALRITHCAAEPRSALEVMVDATFTLLEACVKHRVKRVVAASSASIYGMADDFPTTETQHPYNNRTLYGAAKAFNEGLLRSFADMYGLEYVALRYFNVYGPRMDVYGKYTEVMIRWMEMLSAGKRPIIFGDGLQTMDFVDVRDVARANILAAEGDAAKVHDRAFNVASGTETSLLDLLKALAAAMACVPNCEFQQPRAVNPVPRRLASTALAEKMLGFKATIALHDGLRDLVDWWRNETLLNGKAL